MELITIYGVLKVKNIIILIFLFHFLIQNSFAQSEYQFVIPSISKNLSHNSVQCIYQDSYGFIWFGTEGGLNKYDGYTIKEYLHNPDDSTSISNNNILSIYEDPDDSGKVLWIGTNDGLNKFDRYTEKFSTFRINDNSSQQLNIIKCINNDNKGKYWLGGKELKSFNKITKKIKSYHINLNSLYVYCISADKNNFLWLGTNEGLVKFNTQNENFILYKLHNDNPHQVNRNAITALQLDNQIIWAGTYEGIYIFNKYTVTFKRPVFTIGDPDFSLVREIKKDKYDNLWIVDGALYKINHNRDSLIEYQQRILEDNYSPTRLSSLEIDKSGNLWIGIVKNGILKCNPIRKKFQHFKYDPKNPMSLYFNDISSFMEDELGKMWVGATIGGLNKFDKKTKKFYVASGSPVAYNITKDLEGVLWFSAIGCMVSYNPITNDGFAFFGKGIVEGSYNLTTIYEDQSKNLAKRKFLYESAVKKNLVAMRDAGNGIFYCFVDCEGTTWVLTGPGRTINIFDNKNNIYIPYTIKTDEDISNSIQFLFEDSNKNLWFGTDAKGLIKRIKIDSVNKTYVQFKNKPGISNSISSNIINVMCEDDSGYIWVGTDLGLNKFDPINETFKRYLVKDGLPSDLIAGILIDDYGKIWISTNKGLSRFDPKTDKFRNFDESYGLQSNTFNIRSCYKDREGYLYFGGSNGFNMFKSDEIKDNPNMPKIVITGFQIFNKPVKIGNDSPLQKPIEFCDEIILNHDQNVLTFEFSALEYTNPRNNIYQYKMEGIDPDWVNTTAERRFASYTQIDPGEYKFKVRGSNNDGIWSKNEAAINVIILPPWWKTYWAYFTYVLLTLLLFYILWRFQTNQIKLKHQVEIDHLQSEKFKEMDRLKSHFFANISHEFRTPLTLILGPVKQIIENITDNKMKQKLHLVNKNANKLLELVNQLLDLSKLEAEKMTLNITEENLVPLTKGMVLSFVSLAESRNISLSFNSFVKELFLYVDVDKFGKIINNLLSNAIKFNNDGGTIEIDISRHENSAEIKIADSGIGIPKQRLDKIFDRFYQADNSKTREFEGTGIGLALTKELVELHHGNIKVDSNEGIGTTFTVTFLLGKEHFNPKEIKETKKISNGEFTFEQSIDYITNGKTKDDKVDIEYLMDSEKPVLIVVEDNEDVRNYIISYLETDYIVIEAENGVEGLEKSIEYIPDLIISDVMMPKMDGFEFCEKVKTDEKTSHIPVILLTAKASGEDKISGLKTGADDYLMKPFDAKELQVRIKNLIEQRKKLREHFKKSELISFQSEKVNSVDKIFLQNAINNVNKNLSDASFSVQAFAENMAMSRSQLHRKLIALIDESPGDLIRRIRLTKAAELIKDKFGNIAEISLEVGYNNPANFSRSFTNQFGISPSEYQNRKEK